MILRYCLLVLTLFYNFHVTNTYIFSLCFERNFAASQTLGVYTGPDLHDSQKYRYVGMIPSCRTYPHPCKIRGPELGLP
jgi:hypothetical protein